MPIMRRGQAVPAILSAGVILFPLGASARATAKTWTGTWSTSYNAMHLTQTGSHVDGTYELNEGHLSGTVSGNVLEGRWDEAPTRQGHYAGPFTFTMSADGKSFTGTWGRDEQPGVTLGTWNGTCVAGPCLGNASPPPPPPPPPKPKPAGEAATFSVHAYANDVRVGPPLVGWFQLCISHLDGSGALAANGSIASGGRLVQRNLCPARRGGPRTKNLTVVWQVTHGSLHSLLSSGDEIQTLTLKARVVASLAPTCPIGSKATITLRDSTQRLKNRQTDDFAQVLPNLKCPGQTQGWTNKDDPNTNPPKGGVGGGKFAVVRVIPK